LNGWKDIAAYLGRSVRTVQRWEKEFGLPVRRLGTSRPESVFALLREVDAWLETAQGLAARSGAGPSADLPGAPSSPGAQPGPLFPRAWFMHMARAAVAIVLTVFVVWASWMTWQVRRHGQSAAASPPAGAPADWRVDLDALLVTDSAGAVLWQHQFPFDLAIDAYKSPTPSREQLGGVGDVDGDGRREVWFVTRPARLPGPQESALYFFNSDGSLRWQHRLSGTVRFGQDTYGPAWFVSRVFVTADPAGGRERAIWAVMYDAAMFPTLLQRLDPRAGKPLSAYWSNGYILTVALDLNGNRRRLLVGACDNEHKAGSLAVLDALNPNGSAPAETGKYRCTSCPPGEPQAFLVFPKPPRFSATGQTGGVFRIAAAADGSLTVGVLHGQTRTGLEAAAIYTLDASLRPVSVDTADQYKAVYQAMVAEGAAPAGAPDTIDADREFLPILRWDSAARRFVQVPKAAAAR
jgi:hypothetical protein